MAAPWFQLTRCEFMNIWKCLKRREKLKSEFISKRMCKTLRLEFNGTIAIIELKVRWSIGVLRHWLVQQETKQKNASCFLFKIAISGQKKKLYLLSLEKKKLTMHSVMKMNCISLLQWYSLISTICCSRRKWVSVQC